MIELPRKVAAAVEAVLDIAYYGPDRPVLAGDAAERQGVTRRGLEPLLQQLTRVDILASNRGPNGGYRLARSRGKISVADIVRAVLSADERAEPPGGGSALSIQVLSPLWRDMQERLWRDLEALTIDDLYRRARAANVPRDFTEITDDFVI